MTQRSLPSPCRPRTLQISHIVTFVAFLECEKQGQHSNLLYLASAIPTQEWGNGLEFRIC